MGTDITASTYLVKIPRVLWSASARKTEPLQWAEVEFVFKGESPSP